MGERGSNHPLELVICPRKSFSHFYWCSFDVLETREWERGRAVEGCVINNSRPTLSIAHMGHLEILAEEELLFENPDDSSRT